LAFLLHHRDFLRPSPRLHQVRLRPFSKILPDNGCSAPAINLKTVDFPLAFGPNTATISPGLT